MKMSPRSQSRKVVKSHSRTVVQSQSRKVAKSQSRTVVQSYSRTVAQSHSRTVPSSLHILRRVLLRINQDKIRLVDMFGDIIGDAIQLPGVGDASFAAVDHHKQVVVSDDL